VILKLALYARDAMPQGGRLRIETSLVEVGDSEHFRMGMPAGCYVLLTLSHNAYPVTREARAQPDEPHIAGRTAGERSGLRLATVCGLVQKLGGHIAVTGEPGGGRTFRVYFPGSGARGPSSIEASPEVPGGVETVLLVEDSVDIRALVQGILSTLGYAVLEASTGPEALKLAECHTGRIHLLVTDIAMPEGVSGTDLAKQLIDMYPGVKVLFITAYAGVANGPSGLVREGNFLAKPFSLETLASKVRQVLESSRSGSFI
jgi:CheY-like chemotaxis protein